MCLEAQIAFWASYPCSVIVVDGSHQKRGPKFHLPSNFRYIHSDSGIIDRLKIAAKEVRTEYASLMGDDEIHMPTSLGKCVELLDGDPEYNACIGRPIGFTIPQSGVVNFTPVYDWFDGKNVSDESAGSRLKCHLENYLPITSYAVTRSENFRFATEWMGLQQDPAFAQDELIFETLTVLRGKVRILDEVHWMRSFVPVFVDRSSEPALDDTRSFVGFWNSQGHQSWRCEFLANLTLAAERIGTLKGNPVGRILNSAFDLYCQQAPNSSIRFLIRLKQWSKRKGGPLVSLLIRLKKLLLSQWRIGRPVWSPEEFVAVLAARDMTVDHLEFEKFLDHVQKMHALKS